MQFADSSAEICVVECARCLHACVAALDRVVSGRSERGSASCILHLMDAIQACEFAIGLISRGSSPHEEFCALCGEICERCADHLQRIGQNESCQDACRSCAAACFDVWGTCVGSTVEHSDRFPATIRGSDMIVEGEYT